jgi:hypothetical protein
MNKWGLMSLCGITTAALFSAGVAESLAAGSISGTVTFSGNAPANPKIRIAKNADYCGTEIELPGG